MDNEGEFLYLGWFEFLNSAPGNKFHSQVPTWNIWENLDLKSSTKRTRDLVEMCHNLQTGHFPTFLPCIY